MHVPKLVLCWRVMNLRFFPSQALTPVEVRAKILVRPIRARSSMVEQRPFKPLVQGSSPCALTFCLNFHPLLVADPRNAVKGKWGFA